MNPLALFYMAQREADLLILQEVDAEKEQEPLPPHMVQWVRQNT